tara:strand:- start:254 stop:1063 length:810 start_codon:yes stop_codon:yes gene_type:complete
MSSFTGKSIKNVYKDILHTDNSNNGISGTIKQIKCGDGDATALYLSVRNAKIQPAADTTSNTVIYDADGNALITVDSINDLVKLGIGQHIANTQYHQFGLFDFSPTAGEHHALMNNSWMPEISVYTGHVNGSAWGGTGTNPATSLTVASASHELVPAIWLLQANITIDEVNYVMGSDAASTINLHVMQYDIATGSGSTAGDLSNGVVLAQTGSASDSLSPITTGDDRVSNGTLTINTANVNSGKAVMLFAEASDTDDMTVSVNIKYHLR